MILDRIELFLAVAKYQSLGKTAREMHVSASSVCQRLKSLENDFGVKLYKKNKEGIELTVAGETVLATGSEVLNKLDTLRKTLNPDSETAALPLTIGGTYNPSAKYLPSAIAAFQKTHPNVQVRFITSVGPSIEKLLREDGVDLAMIHSPSKSSDFNLEPFAADNLAFFAHPMYPLAKKKKLDLKPLAQTPLIIREGREDATDKMLKAIKSRGLTPNIVLRCASPAAVKAAVRRKMGVGILFHNLIEEEIKRKDLKTLKFSGLPKLMDNSYIVYRKNKALPCAANDFLTLLRSMKTHLQNPVNSSETNED